MENKKLCIITGATSGIGKYTAVSLSKKGFQLVLPVRNIEKGNALKATILKEVSNAEVDIFYCDLESLSTVRQFAEAFKSKYSKLDVLINNAGVWNTKFEKTEDGFEKNFAINHLAHFLLTNQLLSVIKETPNARIINVSSDAHKFSKMNFEDLQGEKKFSSFKAYGQSKLANILFTRHLSKILNDTSVTVNCLHPGVVSTNLFDKMGSFLKSIFSLFMISPEKGAATTIYLATSEEVGNISGKYFKNKKVVKPIYYALKDEDANKLWEESLKLLMKNNKSDSI